MKNDDSIRLSAETSEHLHAQHAESLLAFLIGLTKNSEDAQDCLQASFVALQEKGGGCAPGARRAWLFRVAYNEAMKLFRSRKLAGPMDASEKVNDASMESDSPFDSMLRRERVEEVRRVLDQLPDELRVIVQHRIVDGMRFREIADRLGIPLGTALGRMRKAMRMLSEQLSDD